MKKILKRFLIGAGSIIIVIVILFVGYQVKTKSEIQKMTPVESNQILDSVYSIRDSFVNIYLINDGGRFIAVDAGNDIESVLLELKKLRINPDSVVAVFLTHTDRDHVAAIKLFKNAYIYLSKEEEQLITGKKSRFLKFGNKIDKEDYLLLEDGYSIKIGNSKVKSILTPGHTPGSMCYLINNKFLFTGDLLSLKSGKVDNFNTFFNMDSETALKSIKKISAIPKVSYIFTAHYGYSDNYKNAIQNWVNLK